MVAADTPDEVGRAIKGVHRAVTRLVKYLTSDDANTRDRAMALIIELGPTGINSLLDTLGRSKDLRRRSRLIAALGALTPTAPKPILTALKGVLERETDDSVRLTAVAAISAQDRSVFERYATPVRSLDPSGPTPTGSNVAP